METSLFAGDGEVRALLRAFDWTASPLGHPTSWPAEIRVLVRQMLNSKFPMWVAWGEPLHMIYNDAYCDILLERHPGALGRPVVEVWWELRRRIVPLLHQAASGVSIPLLVMPFDVMRGGQPESVWFNFTLTPVLGEDNGVSGVMCLITESTFLKGAHEHLAEQEFAAPSGRDGQKYLM